MRARATRRSPRPQQTTTAGDFSDAAVAATATVRAIEYGAHLLTTAGPTVKRWTGCSG